MRSVYLVGQSGAGKSTVMQALLERMEYTPSENVPLRVGSIPRLGKPQKVTLTGHRLESPWAPPAAYLGVLREEFPGTDGLNKIVGPVAAEWLEEADVPVVLGEGVRLGSRPFLKALSESSEMLLVYLLVDPETRAERAAERGHDIPPSNVQSTGTQAKNVTEYARTNLRCQVESFDTGVFSPDEIAEFIELHIS